MGRTHSALLAAWPCWTILAAYSKGAQHQDMSWQEILYTDKMHRYLDIPRLVAWLSSRQYAPEGGFSGRTNKLVDGCYSHWVGGCFPLIQACLNNIASGNDGTEAAYNAAGTGASCTLPPAPETLFSREGLMRYILCCCQDQTERGGLRDKPGK
jgi:protein farnesyltransferase subunit beta